MGSWLKAAKDSANQQDVLTDTFDSFVPETMRHNMHRSSNTHKDGHMRLHDEPEENSFGGGDGVGGGRRRANTDENAVDTSATTEAAVSSSRKEEGHFINQNLERTLSEDDASLRSNRR